MPNAVVTLKKGAGRTLKQGGPWIYDNEAESIMGSFTDGDIVLVHDFDGYPLGRGGFVLSEVLYFPGVRGKIGDGSARKALICKGSERQEMIGKVS